MNETLRHEVKKLATVFRVAPFWHANSHWQFQWLLPDDDGLVIKDAYGQYYYNGADRYSLMRMSRSEINHFERHMCVVHVYYSI